MENPLEILLKYFGRGRMLAGSKSGYRSTHPNNIVIFNASVAIVGHNKVWYGDLDLTKDENLLLHCSREIGKPLYVFYEMDLRFENEKLDVSEATKTSYKYYVVDGIKNEITEHKK
jgi:hypothetical protein